MIWALGCCVVVFALVLRSVSRRLTGLEQQRVGNRKHNININQRIDLVNRRLTGVHRRIDAVKQRLDANHGVTDDH